VADLIAEPERSTGLHAGLAETSLMLHLAPELVGSLPAADGQRGPQPPPGWSLEGAAPTAWLSHDLSDSGVIGDPSGATAALGEQLAQRLVDGWCALLTTLIASDWPQPR
jgi:creatinine amidohydrolase